MNETEIGIAVAAVVGWRDIKTNPFTPNPPLCGFNDKQGKTEAANGGGPWGIPDYCTDANAALAFCDVLKKQGWGWVAMDVDNSVRFIFHKRGELSSSMVVAPTFALAICIAGLKALGKHHD